MTGAEPGNPNCAFPGLTARSESPKPVQIPRSTVAIAFACIKKARPRSTPGIECKRHDGDQSVKTRSAVGN